MHLPRGQPTASWEEASSAHQAGLGLGTESSQSCLIIPSIHLPHDIQSILGQAPRGLDIKGSQLHRQLSLLTVCLAPGLDLNMCQKDGHLSWHMARVLWSHGH